MAKKENNFRKYIKWLWIVVASPFVLMTLLICWRLLFGNLPSFEELENPNSNLASEVYTSDQKLLGKYYRQNRSNIHYNELSPNVVNALLATEDIRFRTHSGIDIRGLMRAVFKGGSNGGASTITQQLAKNLFHDKPRTKVGRIIQKVDEWIISTRLERNYTKDEIIAMYLNTVEFSSNAFGIKSAARTYFSKDADSLSVNESAMLVGMLQAPTKYNPTLGQNNYNNSIARRNIVLGQMKKYELITQKQFDTFKEQPIILRFQAEDQNTGRATYFREVLKQELMQWCATHKKSDGTPYNLYTDGLKVYTTINSKMQQYAEEAVKEYLTELQKSFNDHWKGRDPWGSHKEILTEGMKRSDRYAEMKKAGASESEINKAFNSKTHMQIFTWKGGKDTVMTPMDSIKYHKKILQTGFMSIEPQTGYIRAWVGGNDYRFFKYDHVKVGRRQVGSTIKPFLYTVAIQEGFSPCYRVPNQRVTIDLPTGQVWSPENSDGKYGGLVTLKEGLAESMNTVSSFLMKQFGPQAMIDIAHKMGINDTLPPVPSICLGTPDISVFNMVGAYATFANKGVWTEPLYITRIEDKNGNVLEERVPKKIEAISEQTAYVMLNLLKGVVEFGTSMRLRFKYGLTNPIAGKTGTTQNQSDGWFMGITPDLVSGAWVGCEDRSVHFRTTNLGQGANTGLPIWALYMKKVYADKTLKISKEDFEKPSSPLTIELDCNKYVQPGHTDSGNDDWK